MGGGFGPKLLVLGDSHYCEDPSDATPEMTRDLILDLYDPNSKHEGYKNTYIKFERALAGKALDFGEKKELWNSLMFYNYVQEPMPGPRIKPTYEQFENSIPLFFKVLEEYQPDCVIAWGKRLYNNLPPDNGHKVPQLTVPGAGDFDIWAYDVPFGSSGSKRTIPVMKILHPSSSFSPMFWHTVISAFLAQYKCMKI